MQGPILSRVLLRVSSWMVPASLRAEWRLRWDSLLENGWVLLQRGELNRDGQEWLAACCWTSFREALDTQYVCDAVLKSARTNRWEKVVNAK